MASEKFCPVSTKTLREVIEAADARPTCKRVFIKALSDAKVFEEETIGSLALGLLLGRLTSDGTIPSEPSVDVIIGDVKNLDKLPILE